MSTGAIIAIAVGGTVIFGAAIVAFVLWIMRMNKRQEAGALARLAEESARRGWKFEERNDSYCAVYNEADTYIQQSLVSQVVNPGDPLAGRLRAIEAHEIISGTHRGRPFLAARFKVTRPGPGSSLAQAIWVQAPGRGRRCRSARPPGSPTGSTPWPGRATCSSATRTSTTAGRCTPATSASPARCSPRR